MAQSNLPNSSNTSKKCSVEGCQIRCHAKGLCNSHYERERRRNRRNNPSSDVPPCVVSGCEFRDGRHSFRIRGMCPVHYIRWLKNGNVASDSPCNIGTGNSRVERFWSRVDKSGGDDACWQWIAGKGSAGYGMVKIAKKRWLAHQFAFFLATGHEATNLVLHHCDNRLCCNPKHLYDGTPQDNARDMYERGRHPSNGYKKVKYD